MIAIIRVLELSHLYNQKLKPSTDNGKIVISSYAHDLWQKHFFRLQQLYLNTFARLFFQTVTRLAQKYVSILTIYTTYASFPLYKNLHGYSMYTFMIATNQNPSSHQNQNST